MSIPVRPIFSYIEKLNIISCGLFLMLLYPSYSVAEIIHVKQNPSTSSNGETWSSAYSTIMTALQAAQPGDQVWVANGDYREPNLPDKPGIQLWGVFEGHERTVQERNPQNQSTVITGESFQNLTGPFLLDGFTLSHRSGSSIQVDGQQSHFRNCTFQNCASPNAGAVFCFPGSAVFFENCTFQHTRSNAASSVMIERATAVFTRCSFIQNGQIKSGNTETITTVGASENSFLLLQDCRFIQNDGLFSGTVYSNKKSTVQIEACLFEKNTSQRSGGAIALADGTLAIQRSIFRFNTAKGLGGALAISNSNSQIVSSTMSWNLSQGERAEGGGLFLSEGTCSLDSCHIANNFSKTGGGISMLSQEQAILNNCQILDNVATKNGGGLACSGAIRFRMQDSQIQHNFSFESGSGLFASTSNDMALTNCIFKNNICCQTNFYGGGAFFNKIQATIGHSQFIHNETNRFTTLGGGIYALHSTLKIHHTLLCQNLASRGSEIGFSHNSRLFSANCTYIADNSLPHNAIISLNQPSQTEPIIHNSLFWRYQLPIYPKFKILDSNLIVSATEKNVPQYSSLKSIGFKRPEWFDFRLRSDSILIDAGVGTEAMAGRMPYDGNGDGIAEWDIGAYEYRGEN